MEPVAVVALGLGGLVLAWLLTAPLHAWKELRPMTPRDIAAEAADGVVVRAVHRHAICPGCHTEVRPTDVVPVVSWWRGCPRCATRFPWSVPALQIALPSTWVLTAVALGNWWYTLPLLSFCVVVVVTAVIDARILLIPWWMPWLGAAVGLALSIVSSVALDDLGSLPPAVVTGVVLFVIFAAVWFVAPGGLGFGDVRFAFLIGVQVGWLAPVLAVWALLIGSACGIVIGVVARLSGHGRHFAFGPALAAGALLAVWLHDLLLG